MTTGTLATVLAIVVILALVIGPWLLRTSSRLDRLHVRTDAAWSGLDAALARRAVVTRAVVAAGYPNVAGADSLRAAADAAELADRVERESIENELSRLLAKLDRAALPRGLAEELSDAEHRVVLARRVHNDAVRDTRALRRRRLVRWLRMAGTAPYPDYFEIAEPELASTIEVRLRQAARVVLIDNTDRILLFHGFDPDRPNEYWWFTPGGGMEEGERLTATAVRELGEETGIRVSEGALVGPAWVRRVNVTVDGILWHAEEWYFLSRLDRSGVDLVDTSGFTELEKHTIDGHRWWTVSNLAGTAETVYPRQLAELLPNLLADEWDGHTRSIY